MEQDLASVRTAEAREAQIIDLVIRGTPMTKLGINPGAVVFQLKIALLGFSPRSGVAC